MAIVNSERSANGGPRWPLGCQLRPWLQTLGPEDLAARLPDVMATVARIGFTGFETALACLPLADPGVLATWSAAANDLRLCAAHGGGPWTTPDGEAHIAPLVAQAERLPALGCHRLAVSLQQCPEHASSEELGRIAATLGQLGRACRESAGVAVVFHNHAGELANDAAILMAIVERCPPEDVNLGADLGWVARAGTDVATFIRRFGPRLTYLHVRDVATNPAPAAFIEIGRGNLDQDQILGALGEVGYTGWLVAESEFGNGWRGASDEAETTHRQFQGLYAAATRPLAAGRR